MGIQLRFVVIYLSVFLLSIIASTNLNKYYIVIPESPENLLAEYNNDWAFMFVWIVFGAILMYFIIKSPFSKVVIKLMELAIVFTATSLLLYSFLLPILEEQSYTVGIMGGLIVVLLRMLGKYRNEIATLSTAGVAALLGFGLTPLSSLFLMGALAVYDYIAVFKTKHMQVLARELNKEETAFSIKEKEKHVVNGEVKEEFIEMGTGDLLIPALVASSFAKVSFIYSFSIIIGTFIGFSILLFTLKKYRRILPAIPFLFVGIVLSLIMFIFLDSLYFAYLVDKYRICC